MLRNNSPHATAGFTLVEMLVIAPFALLIIAGFLTLMISMAGEAMVSHGQNGMRHNLQASMDMIERDVRLSTEFVDDTGAMPSPQGKNDTAAAFTSASDLILGQIATDKNPFDPTSVFVHYNTPYTCSDPAHRADNALFFTTVIYFVQNGSLWRRTFVPDPVGGSTALCVQPWQVNTCTPGYTSTATRCKANDTEVMHNVSSFTVSYYASDGTLLTATDAPKAAKVSVTINGQQSVAGRNLAATASLHATKLSNKDIKLPPPAIPVVTAQPYTSTKPSSATFTWPTDPLLTYNVRYSINGGVSWLGASMNTKSGSVTLSASRGDTITVQVSARNSTGESGFGVGASQTLPSWESCALKNGWSDYGSPYKGCGFTKSKYGTVMLSGMIKGGTATANTNLFTLPAGYCPAYRLIFSTTTNKTGYTYGGPSRIDIIPSTTDSTCQVQLISGSANWLALNDINFIPNGSLYTWNSVGLSNSWQNFGSPYSPFQAFREYNDRVHLQGLVKPGATTSNTIAWLPMNYQTEDTRYFPIASDTDSRADVRIDAGASSLISIDHAGTWYSIQQMYYPDSYYGTNLSLLNGWKAKGYDASGAPYSTPMYRREDDCIVSLQGTITKSTTPPAGDIVATLPVGYRPSATLTFHGVAADKMYRIDILSNGNIQVYSASATWTSLDGINFMAGDGSPCLP